MRFSHHGGVKRSALRFRLNKEPRIDMWGPGLNKTVQSILIELAAAHTISAVQAFITGSGPNRNMSAGIAGRCVTLHTLRSRIYCAHS